MCYLKDLPKTLDLIWGSDTGLILISLVFEVSKGKGSFWAQIVPTFCSLNHKYYLIHYPWFKLKRERGF